MKKLIIGAAIIAVALPIGCYFYQSNQLDKQHDKDIDTILNKAFNKKPVDVAYFKDMQVLLPDYACPDTVIVMDAKGMNKAFAYVEQNIDWGTDADIDSLIHVYCLTYDLYLDYLEGVGWRKDIAKHIADVDFGRKPKDNLYYEMMED